MIFWASELWTWYTDTIKRNPWVGKTHFLHGFGLITHPILMMSKWKAQNILTRSISYDILGVLIMDMIY
jgi:hypothetical protein